MTNIFNQICELYVCFIYLYIFFSVQLVCSVCGHTSVKYDPFGTLSVPLPYANQIQISK